MWSTLLLYILLWPLSQQSKLTDLLSATDHIFEDVSTPDTEVLELMLKRTYNLNYDLDEHKISKRSIDLNYPLFRDKQGVYILSNIEDVLKIPVKFPNDINILSSHNLLYITTLEANGTDPENQLANDLVLFQYSSIQGIKEIGRVPVLGGTKIALYSFRNETYLVSAEYEAKNTPDSFQGSTVYKIMERNGRSFLEKIQILSVTQPNDLKFWEHQDQLYLVVGTNLGNDTLKSGVLIYRWLGYHFDCLQVIPSSNVKSVTPFIIGSVMYIAVAKFHDEYGMVDTESEVLQFNLQEMMFKPFQRIKTHGAQDFSYFTFDSTTSKQSEHFLIVANSLSRIRNGTLSALTESVVYKFSEDRFIPFQSFKLHGAKQWLPIKGANGEFLLLAVHSYGVVGFQYDGWRFSQVLLQFGQTPFGDRIQSIRTFQYFGEIFISSADKSSYGNKINLWKLAFTNKNDLEKEYKEIENWCSDTSSKMANDNFEETLNNYKSFHKISERAESLKVKDFNEEMLDELEQLREGTENLERILQKTEENVKSLDDDIQEPIILGSKHISSLEIKYKTKDSCSFKNLKVSKLNGENFSEFLSDAVFLDDSLIEPVLEFEHVVVKDDLYSTMVNGHPSETLVDVSSQTFINSELIVNGTVFIKGDFNVNGLFDGVLPDEDHLLLNEGTQTFEERLTVDLIKVKNLKLSGRVNDEPVENLLQTPQIELENSYKELKVNNMFIEGLINGQNLTQVFKDLGENSEDQEIDGDLDIHSLEAEEVFVDSNEISNISIPELLRIYNEHRCLSNKNEFIETNILSKREISSEKFNSPENIIIVEGFLKTRDIISGNNSTSLLDIITNSYRLNDSVVHSNFVFSDVVAENVEAKLINGVPISSWVSKNSSETQQIDGKKDFRNDVYVQKTVNVEMINNVNLKELEKDVLRLSGDQVVFADLGFDTINCYEIETNSTNFGNKYFDSIGFGIKEGSKIGRLQVEDLLVFGNISSVSWNNLLNDSIFNADSTVLEEKTITGTVQAETLHLNGKINDLLFEEFVELASKDVNKILLDRNVTLENPLRVDELNFEGFLDSTLKPNFELEWLLKDDAQIITGPMTFHNVEMKQGSNLMNETVNNISLRKLFTRSIKVDEDTKIKYLFTVDKIKAHRIDIGGTLSGADFNGSVVKSKAKTAQEFSGEWFLNKGLVINGSLVVQGQVSGLNLTSLCSLETPEKANLIVGGSVRLRHEPIVRDKVNGIDLIQKSQDIWMADTNTTLTGENITFNIVEFQNKTTAAKSLNGANMTHISKFYLSKSLNRVISAEYEFDELVIKNSCRMHTANVEGAVNGVNLTHWAQNVLLQNKDQVIQEKLRFEIFQTNDLILEGTINGMDLSKDVLRLDVDDAVVVGEKTFRDINVLNLTLAKGRKLQGVDIDAWRESLVKTTGDVVIKGDLTLSDSIFKGPFMVHGTVNDIHFDTKNILTTAGNQIMTAAKTFNYTSNPNQPMRIKFLKVSGKINGVDFDDFIKNQAYSDRDLVFTQPKVFTKGLNVGAIEVEGLVYGVNVSDMCNDVFNPVNVNAKRTDFFSLINQTQKLIEIVKGRSFFLDYFELVQTLKPKVRAVVPTLDNEGNYLLAVFTPKMMTFMDWNDHSESFANTDEVLQLSENITFVTSEITNESSLLYIERTRTAMVMKSESLKEIEATETSCIASFQLKALNKSCIFIGQKRNSSRILCDNHLTEDLQTYQWLDSKGSVQVAVINVEDDIYIAAINKEEIFDKTENTLVVYHFDTALQHFYVFNTLGEVNPVAVSAIAYKNDYYLVSAGGHLPESVHNSVLSIFKYNKHHNAFVRSQSIRVDTPVDVHFALLPSSELALYVLTSNPTKPFIVFLHRGISGFMEATSGYSLYPGSNLYSFTDSQKRHFVMISGFGRGQILKAGFKGN